MSFDVENTRGVWTVTLVGSSNLTQRALERRFCAHGLECYGSSVRETLRWNTSILWLALFVGFSGCADRSPTELVIDVFAEIAVVEQADAVRLRVVEDRDGRERVAFDDVLLDPEWPVRHVVLGRGGEELIIEAFALRGESESAPVRARAQLVTGESQWLPLVLSDGCWGRTCSTSESCESTSCAPIPAPVLGAPPPRRPANTLDASVDAEVGFDAGHDAAVDGGGSDVDGGLDAGLDAGRDAGVDAGFDAGRDAGVDAGLDAGRDAGVDAGFDAGRDAGLDAGFDAGSCMESPCRLVAPQCGCSSGQACYFESGARGCHPVGTSMEGQACSSDRCAAGLTCDDVSVTSTRLPLCLRYCSTDADCVGGPGSRCLVGEGAEPRRCTASCDVVTQTGCPNNVSCAILESGAGIRYTHCSGPLGTGGQEASCVDDTSCQRGFRCVNVGGTITDNRCLRWCRRSAPASSCPGGSSCQRLGAAPGLVLNGAEYGVCF